VPHSDLVETHRTAVERWLGVWSVPELAQETTVEWSSRMTSSLGRSHPRTGVVRVAAYLQKAETALVEEVLCHELAHVAAYAIHGERLRTPHGPEWKQLMRAVGYEPRARLRIPDGLAPKRKRRRSYAYVHWCLFCKMPRIARRVMRRWRCASCRHNGLDGELHIVRVKP